MPRKAKNLKAPPASPEDIVILVMGPTGVGKSTFINTALGREIMAVGYEIESCTVNIDTARVDTSTLLPEFPWLKNRRLLLVDTPGFDDTFADDCEILERIAKWLKASYRTQLLGGIIYLHNISDNRFTGTARKNLVMFNRLCGEGAISQVVLGTTMASRLSDAEAAKRLARLKEAHWKDMMDKGAQVFECDKVQLTALNLVKAILGRFQETTVLAIQHELVDKHKIIPETEAGKELRYTLQQMRDQQKRAAQLAGKAEQGDTDAAADLLEAKKQIEQLSKHVEQLKVPWWRLLGIRL